MPACDHEIGAAGLDMHVGGDHRNGQTGYKRDDVGQDDDQKRPRQADLPDGPAGPQKQDQTENGQRIRREHAGKTAESPLNSRFVVVFGHGSAILSEIGQRLTQLLIDVIHKAVHFGFDRFSGV